MVEELTTGMAIKIRTFTTKEPVAPA